ncbi:39S ribosomal protein L47, mitochondrial [Borealophlyctis nickersoniae]|nr:39S ribosomal protein L47, mitochondrial [Borealophlyctis nickersoniae]
MAHLLRKPTVFGAFARPFSTTTCVAAGLRSSLAPAVRSARVAAPLRRGLEEFFDDEKGWFWTNWEKPTGRAWLAAELRTKSFDDLHKLWWVCAKEENKLASQKIEARRFRLQFPHDERRRQVKLTMNRIKQVVWERRINWFAAQSVLRREETAAELRGKGLSEEEVEQKIKEMFPLPVEDVGRKPLKLRMRALNLKKMEELKLEKKSRPTMWTIV